MLVKLSAEFSLQRVDLVFGDFKASNSMYNKIPDVACTNSLGQMRFLGEMKTHIFWYLVHGCSPRIRREECSRVQTRL
jgi:hypothetical protein